MNQSPAERYFLHLANADYLGGERRWPILRHDEIRVWEVLIGAIFCFGAALVCGVIFAQSYITYTDLRDNGVTMEGIVVRHREDCSGRGACRHYLTYTYVVNDKSYRAEQKVSRNRYSDLPDGSSVALLVATDENQPTHVRIEGTNEPPILWGIAAVGSGIAGVGMLIYQQRKRGHETIYREAGQVVIGQIHPIEAGYEWHWRHRRVFYAKIGVTFTSPTTQQVINRILVSHLITLKRRMPPDGAEIAIYYVDDQYWWVL